MGDDLKRGNLGYINGFGTDDFENLDRLKIEAKENGWKIRSVSEGRCDMKYICDEGGWCYSVDSSD